MEEHELRQAFHATFDRARPAPDAADRAFQAVVEAADERDEDHWLRALVAGRRAPATAWPAQAGAGRRLATATAVVLTVLVIAMLLISRGALTPLDGAPAAQPSLTPVVTLPPATRTGGPVVNLPAPAQVAALDSRVVLAAWGATSTALLTRDGGATWADAHIPGVSATFQDIQWVDGDTAYAATSAGLFRFQLSAQRWSSVSSRSDLVRLDFLPDRTREFALTAAGDVLESDDAGVTFTARDVGARPVTWLQWVSTTQAWAAGPDGVVATGDGGATWTHRLSFPDSRAGATALVGFADVRNGFALLDQPPATVLLYHTSDGGAHWALEPGAPQGVHSQLVVTGPAQAALVSANSSSSSSVSVCATGDGGRAWHCQPAPSVGPASSMTLTVKGLTWTLAGPGLPLAVSQDAGATWAIRRP